MCDRSAALGAALQLAISLRLADADRKARFCDLTELRCMQLLPFNYQDK